MAKKNSPQTVGELLYWSYANLAMAHAAVSSGSSRYHPGHYAIRGRLYKGLCSGTMKIRSLFDDERMKMKLPQVCNYCGCSDNLSLDHMIPRSAGGPDTGENLVWACRSCNSSKGTKDLLVWMKAKDKFPPILILRRYLKVAIASLDEDQLACSLADPPPLTFPVEALPTWFPAPSQLVLWAPSTEG